MKNLILIFLFTFLTGCKGINNERKHHKTIDSLKTQLNLLKQDNQELKNRIEITTIKTYKNEDFNNFFYSFMVDSIFQKNRVKFPLEYRTTNIDSMKEILIKINKDEWKYNSFYINSASERTQIYDNYDLKFQPTNERMLHWYGVESGGNSKYYFKGFNGKWFLIKKWDSGI
ncbi:DUF4348 domain-containing protein [Tenacibaculum geojense]|uniref:DUF4348 domain-containing protein n=1 Tax=Tenacibaculum geojense TaxID=915352 RepID=A0ABW3JSU0_9FLAO